MVNESKWRIVHHLYTEVAARRRTDSRLKPTNRELLYSWTQRFCQYQGRSTVGSRYSISRPAKRRRSHGKDYPEFGFSAHHAGVALGSLY